MRKGYGEPCYIIGVAARMVQMHPQTLRHYERLGLIVPGRSSGETRFYSDEDIEMLLKVKRLTRDMGVNLAGVEVILKLMQDMESERRRLNEEMNRLQMENEVLRRRLGDGPRSGEGGRR